MGEVLSADKLLLFLVFFVPGFVSLKIWQLMIPSERLRIADQALEIVSFGCLNFAVLFWLVGIGIRETSPPWIRYLSFSGVLLVFPALWPVILGAILKSNLLRGRIVHPTPRSWDYFFNRGELCYVLVHLRGGKLIAGFYGPDSFASSFPNPKDIYLEQVWKVNKNGEFLHAIEDTAGVLISHEYIDYMEFFKPIEIAGGRDGQRKD